MQFGRGTAWGVFPDLTGVDPYRRLRAFVAYFDDNQLRSEITR